MKPKPLRKSVKQSKSDKTIREQLKILKLFGTIDYDETFNYKAFRLPNRSK
jgi:hypothetical protein